VKAKKEKKQVVQARQRECDGGSWGYVGNCTRRCNNGGEFASETGCKCRKKKCYTSTAWNMYCVIACDITRLKNERDHCKDVIRDWTHFKISLCVIASYLKSEEELQYNISMRYKFLKEFCMCIRASMTVRNGF
jgi:hypothetical protein